MPPIYLDGLATTPVDPQVLAAMLPYFSDRPGNASNGAHAYGWEAAAAVEVARQYLAAAINADPSAIIFTSGATEADNLALKGVAEAYYSHGRHIITVQTEHSAVLAPCRYLESVGFRVTYLGVNAHGHIDLEALEEAFAADTILVSVMAANNEIGVVHPLAEIGRRCRDRHVLFHCDAAQALGKVPLDVQQMHIDLMSLTAHKLYGPKGIGALYLRRDRPRVQLAPQLHGGEQEQGWRSGTLATPLIVGFGEAVRLAQSRFTKDMAHLRHLKQHLWQELSALGEVYLNGDLEQSLPNCLNISIGGVDGSALLRALYPHVALSSGSACSSAKATPSHVLLALGRSPQLARATLRFGLLRTTTLEEINQVIGYVTECVQHLRQQATL
ncbi:cysteine desulfurase family protein [Parathermosynechococcus lividus]